MLRVGIVGMGFMGRMHDRCWRAQPGATVAAVCEANPKVVEALGRAGGGNIGGATDHVDLSGVDVFHDLGELIASGKVDALSITLPTFLHPDTTIAALNGGLHVLCEKPMALDPEACDRMIDAARSSGRVLQVGHCLRFWPEYVVARELVHSGKYGEVVAATFRRFTSPPTWSPDGWFADEARSGGQPLDLHIHDSDYIHFLFGLPESVSSAADRAQTYMATQYRYGAGGPAVNAEGSWRLVPSFGFEAGFTILLEGATIVFDTARTPSFRVLPVEGESFTPELPPGDGYTRQIDHFARAAAGEAVEAVVTPEQSRETVRLVHAEKRSAREGRPVSL